MNAQDENNVRVKSPIWIRLSTVIILLLLAALSLDTVFVSVLVGADVRITAESNNYTINTQMADMVSASLEDINNNVWMLLSILSTSWDRNLQIENFFRLHRNIAAVVIPGEMELINKPFFQAYRVDESLIQKEISRMEESISSANFGKSILLNASGIFNFPMLALLFPKQSGNNNAVVVFFSSQELNEAFSGNINQSLMIDYDGKLLLSPDIDKLRSGESSDLIKILDNSHENLQVSYEDTDGIKYFSAYQKIADFNAAVITQVPESLVYEGVNATVRRNVYLSGMILFAAIMFAWIFSRSISRPLHRLAVSAMKIEKGDYAIGDVSFKTNDEVGFLSERFIEMSKGLQIARTELENINEGLEEKVKERTADLAAQTEIAFAASKSKSDFLAQMSHEIRTPMNAIMGFTELMRTENFDETQKSYFKDIKMMSGALLNIINDILDISKIEAGNLSLVPIHYNLYDLFDNVASICRFAAKGKSLEFIVNRSKDAPKIVYGDDIRVRQIYTNILNNAIKYTPKGSVTFTLTAGTKNNTENYIIAKVKDTGIGIKKEDIPKLFGSFQQFDAKKNRGIVGTGLGLAITKQLIDMMKGNIVVDSVYGQGTTFTIYIPFVKGNPALVQQTGNASNLVTPKDGASVNILVVDDSPINITVALGFLERHKIVADSALGGLEALVRIKEKKYDLIFSDHFMPDIDGLELARRIRELGHTMPIIALSANAVSGMREKFLDAGMNDFITKPIEGDAINNALAKWLPKDKIIIGEDETESSEQDTKQATASSSGQMTAALDELSKIEGLDVKQGLKYAADNEKSYILVLKQYCDSLDERLADIKSKLSAGDFKNYSILAHAFKGITATLGHARIAAAAKELEFAGRAAAFGSGDEYSDLYEYKSKEDAAEVCRAKTNALCGALSAFRDHLLKTSPFASDSEKQVLGIAEVKEIMYTLKDALDKFESGKSLKIADALSEYAYEGDFGVKMRAIIKDVNEVEYEAASKKVSALLDLKG
ncbi:MAG: hypothetical protein Ta2B_20280 [Termitinemataceae bacterium]|nr:MAG: hypothetical protein Ta2B_20280 [Termitinemataceae bacterium]